MKVILVNVIAVLVCYVTLSFLAVVDTDRHSLPSACWLLTSCVNKEKEKRVAKADKLC